VKKKQQSPYPIGYTSPVPAPVIAVIALIIGILGLIIALVLRR